MYVIIWEFIAKKRCKEKFEPAYGPEGEWVKLFRHGKGFISTQLLRDTSSKHRYLTIDQWKSESAYTTFRHRYSREYQQLDERFSTLTEYEALIGTFTIQE